MELKNLDKPVEEKKKSKQMYYTVGNITVCLLVEDGTVIARGVAIRSRVDLFDPKLGRKYSLDRAREAAGRKTNCNLIDISAYRGNPFDWFDLSIAKDMFGGFRSFYNPTLTDTERLFLINKGHTIIQMNRE